jgi:hypothetical protein
MSQQLPWRAAVHMEAAAALLLHMQMLIATAIHLSNCALAVLRETDNLLR